MKLGPEDQFQRSAVQLLRLALPKPCIVYSVPNGGNLSRAQAALFQMTGLLAGVHDLHVLWPRNLAGSAFPGGFGTLELKAGRNPMTSEQEAFGVILDACGHPWAEVRCPKPGDVAALERVRDLVASWIAPLQLRAVRWL